MSGLVGYRQGGTVVCIDCDVYPPGFDPILEDDIEDDDVCAECGTPLTEVTPLEALL